MTTSGDMVSASRATKSRHSDGLAQSQQAGDSVSSVQSSSSATEEHVLLGGDELTSAKPPVESRTARKSVGESSASALSTDHAQDAAQRAKGDTPPVEDPTGKRKSRPMTLGKKKKKQKESSETESAASPAGGEKNSGPVAVSEKRSPVGDTPKNSGLTEPDVSSHQSAPVVTADQTEMVKLSSSPEAEHSAVGVVPDETAPDEVPPGLGMSTDGGEQTETDADNVSSASADGWQDQDGWQAEDLDTSEHQPVTSAGKDEEAEEDGRRCDRIGAGDETDSRPEATAPSLTGWSENAALLEASDVPLVTEPEVELTAHDAISADGRDAGGKERPVEVCFLLLF